MAGRSKRIFIAALLIGAVATVSLAKAQPGQTWSDPPPDLNAGPLTSDSRTSAARPLAAQDWPDEAARRRRTPQTAVAQPSRTRDVEETAAIQTAKADAAAAEAARASAARQLRVRQAAAREARAQQVALAEAAREERAKQVALAEAQAARKEREKQAEKARKVQEARVAARARVVTAARERRRVAEQVADAQPARAPQPKVYEVMRLRTLVFPDGQVVQVLTRPDQEAIDLSLR